MTTITIRFSRANGHRLERLATSLAVALLVWAGSRARGEVDHEQRALRVQLEADIRERERGAIRLHVLR